MAKEASGSAKKDTKVIFVVGGVMSGVGKGITTASMAKIIQDRGFRVATMKIDPYINVDAGTMNPTEHGEAFVTIDGDETDQDLGNYERFLDIDLTSDYYMTTGRVYQTVIAKERNLEYGGKCVEVVPHIPLEVIERINKASELSGADVMLVEVGGTIGEYQNILFLEAARMMKQQQPENVFFVMVSYLPIPDKIGEMKTKPTQHAARTLNSAGIQPDFIVGRAEQEIDEKRRQKLAMFCGIPAECVISAPDVDSVYDIPVLFEKRGVTNLLLRKLGLDSGELTERARAWTAMTQKREALKAGPRIGVAGKYFATGDYVLSDAYISVIEAVKHAGIAQNVKPELVWLDSEKYEKDPSALDELSELDGLIVPGGFGTRGIEGKIAAIEYCRTHKIPFLGICYGMQMLVAEFARNVAGFEGANTTEIDANATHPVIDILPEQKAKLAAKDFGGSMRLGAYEAVLKSDTIAQNAYGVDKISERHRHRYEVNPTYVAQLTDAGLVFSGTSADGKLMEIAELPTSEHPFFIGTQFHPEFQSRPLSPHPLFSALVSASIEYQTKK